MGLHGYMTTYFRLSPSLPAFPRLAEFTLFTIIYKKHCIHVHLSSPSQLCSRQISANMEFSGSWARASQVWILCRHVEHWAYSLFRLASSSS